jgi:hypothetical protein
MKKERKKLLIIISVAVSLLILLIALYCLIYSAMMGTLGGYNNNPQYALVQEYDFKKYRQDFEIVRDLVAENQDKLVRNDEFIVLEENGNIQIYFNIDGSYELSKTTIPISAAQRQSLQNLHNMDLYDGQGVDKIYVEKYGFDFECGSETSRLLNYISYRITDNPPQQKNWYVKIHVKKYAPHWYSLVAGNV